MRLKPRMLARDVLAGVLDAGVLIPSALGGRCESASARDASPWTPGPSGLFRACVGPTSSPWVRSREASPGALDGKGRVHGWPVSDTRGPWRRFAT